MTSLAPVRGMDSAAQAAAIDAVLADATLEEKVAMMSGRGFFRLYRDSGKVWGSDPYPAGGGLARLGLPPLYFTDGPRGVARGRSTCFPCTMARGASFDPDLERRIGEVMGIESRAQGCTLNGAVCVNLLRHPAWGRAQETYGEDSHHLGAMGTALAQGIQTHNVIATVKHLAANSMENARFVVNVEMDERALHEVYLPHFRTILEGGCASVMSAYNRLNGPWCGESPTLLTDILRGEWGFAGFVHSDWIMGVHDVQGATAGLDIENPEPRVFGRNLVAAAQAGTVAQATIDTACRRILTTQFRFACAPDPMDYPLERVACADHVALAREAAEKSAVLIRNTGILPLDNAALRRVAVLGRLADLVNTGDNGSSLVRAPHVVTALEGLRAALGEDRIVTGDEDDPAAAVAAAAGADVAVIVAGYTAREEGEWIPGDLTLGADGEGAAQTGSRGGDRVSLDLPDDQIALIEAVAATGTPVVVVIVAGSAVMMEGWHDKSGAILQTFYGGMEGGTALARLLLGAVSPSGRLPFTLARNAAHYPFFDKDATAITYDLWHGAGKLARDGNTARHAFGHGLTYSSFAHAAPVARLAGEAIEVRTRVTNTGARTAADVVQLYVSFPGTAVERPARVLKGFRRVELAPGESAEVTFEVPLTALMWRDTGTWRLEPGPHVMAIGPCAEGPFLETVAAV